MFLQTLPEGFWTGRPILQPCEHSRLESLPQRVGKTQLDLREEPQAIVLPGLGTGWGSSPDWECGSFAQSNQAVQKSRAQAWPRKAGSGSWQILESQGEGRDFEPLRTTLTNVQRGLCSQEGSTHNCLRKADF